MFMLNMVYIDDIIITAYDMAAMLFHVQGGSLGRDQMLSLLLFRLEDP